jgi:hypothetical protein
LLAARQIDNQQFTNNMRYLIAFVTFILPNLILAKPNDNYYDIKITIKGFPSEKAMLGYYYGDKTYVVDSTKVDTKSGKMRFFGNRKLLDGVYFVANTEGVILDFIVNGWKDFSISTDSKAVLDSASVFRSEENKYYFDYLKTVKKKESEIKNLQIDLSLLQYKKDYETFDLYQRKIIEKYRFIDNLTNSSLKRYPDLFFTKLINAHRSPSVSDDIRPFDNLGKPNPTYYYYTCRHFWDEFDFNDTRLLRSKVYVQKVRQYLDQILHTDIDSMKRYSDFLLSKSKVTLEFYQNTLNCVTQFFESRISQPNGDKMYIYVVEHYYQRTGSGAGASKLADMNEKVRYLKSYSIGQKAPLIQMLDKYGYIRCLNESKNKWTLLYYNDSEKETVRTNINLFNALCNDYAAKDLSGYTVCRNPLNEWLRLIKLKTSVVYEPTDLQNKHTYIYNECPIFYLLNKDNIIIEQAYNLDEMRKILMGMDLGRN